MDWCHRTVLLANLHSERTLFLSGVNNHKAGSGHQSCDVFATSVTATKNVRRLTATSASSRAPTLQQINHETEIAPSHSFYVGTVSYLLNVRRHHRQANSINHCSTTTPVAMQLSIAENHICATLPRTIGPQPFGGIPWQLEVAFLRGNW